MSPNPQTEDAPAAPAAYAWCSWHNRFSNGVRLIEAIEQGSGSGGNLFACGPCREAYGLVPFSDRP